MTNSNALSIASRFLQAQSDRDVEAARALAAPEFEVVSPGGTVTRLDALFERLSTAYEALQKLPEGQGMCEESDGIVVYTHGTMTGVRTADGPFEGVRFLDRLVIRDGKVAGQKIWNDFGQPRP